MNFISFYSFLLLISMLPMILVVVAIPNDDYSKSSLASPYQLNQPQKKCQTKCGNVDIPYPFGIGQDCFYQYPNDQDHYYEIECINGSTPKYGDIEVLEILLLKGEIRLAIYMAVKCYHTNGTIHIKQKFTLTLGRYTISSSKNVFAAAGCDAMSMFKGERRLGENKYATGCNTYCEGPKGVENGTCSGAGCCQIGIPGDGVTSVDISTGSYYNYTELEDGDDFSRCSYAFVAERNSFSTFSLANLTAMPDENTTTTAVMDWMIGTENCSTSQNSSDYLCKGPNKVCNDSMVYMGYRCHCLPGFTGNPYLLDGCQDVNECDQDIHDCEKPEYCKNIVGNFTCECPKGFHGLGRKTNPCIQDQDTKLLKIVLGVGLGLFIAMAIGFWMYWQHARGQIIKMKANFFRQNGGQLLHQKLNGHNSSLERFKMFSVEELSAATNNYNDNNILGRGGYGEVYKGTLSNNKVVAIKKSLKVDSNQVAQFVNEVVVLSQLNNKNVVKLLGCCLETEVPLLVYEYINNGTLYDHLHDETKAHNLTWGIRLRIAAEIAEVLAYLHFTIAIPIIHRDIKSMNILMDESYTAKVSDFGTSRLTPMDQGQLATIVQGTCGYLDPEYMQTGELTDKSDVYSFGVVLVELLTREKAISFSKREKDRCLAIYFLRKLKDDQLFEILDDKIKGDGASIEQMKKVADIASRCLQLKGDDRPTMKQVARELDEQKEYLYEWSNNECQFEEDTKYLLNKTQGFIKGYVFSGIETSSSIQSNILELVPLDDGR